MPKKLNFLLDDYAFNIRNIDKNDYKKTRLNTLWNTNVKLLQERYYKLINIKTYVFFMHLKVHEWQEVQIESNYKKFQKNGYHKMICV